MTDLEAIRARHSVRSYLEKPIPPELRRELDACVETCNRESGLHLRVIYDDPAGYDSFLTHYGVFRNVKNYIVLAGKKEDDFDFRCGYYGEKLVLLAQKLGLNTCWTALTFNKKRVRELIPEGESLCMAIALGYGENQGRQHRSKRPERVSELAGEAPDWFRDGLEAALLAPTAVNQQKFCFGLENGEATVRVKGIGSYTRVDLGIAALHFELGSGRKVKALE
ncbi:MAG: nitroreductase [Oscillospiraceae bacterium]|nr:nitroreductase [Oscillospiraceae bacterium]